MKKDLSKDRVTSGALVFSATTFLSRITGFIRDMAIAFYLGTTPSSDAFFVAFRIPNLARRLFGEGSLTASFVPVFVEYRLGSSKERAFLLANRTLTLLLIFLTFIATFGVIASPFIIKVLAPGFLKNPQYYKLSYKLLRLMFPYLIFVCTAALFAGILNSFSHFFAPSFSPIILNLSMIFSLIILSRFMKESAFALSLGVILGGIFQVFFHLPFLKRYGYKLSLDPSFDEGVKKILLLMGPSAASAALYQLNIFITTILASFLKKGSISYLYYANRLFEFPLGIFAVAIGSALLPEASAQIAKKDELGFEKTVTFSFSLILFISIPCAVGLSVLREGIIEILFQHGKFTESATINTANALLCYCIGLPATAGSRVIVPAFYSKKDARTPFLSAAVAIFLGTIASVFLMFPLKHNGLALGTSISSFAYIIFLLNSLNKKGIRLNSAYLKTNLLKTILASFFMLICLEFSKKYIDPKGFGVAVLLFEGVFTYIFSSYIFRNSELSYLLDMTKRRIKFKFSCKKR